MTQSRTHNCNELRLSNAGEKVTLVGWYENLRKVSKNLGFLILRDFYGTTQIVVETEEMMEKLDGVNKESTISVTGTVRERSNKNTELPTGEIEVCLLYTSHLLFSTLMLRKDILLKSE